ncbi:DUF3889 domain-containing protein [Bacillus sp. REN3]|uniref:DUF3889 domain-containing protein n=1 Tax=Bacillus sp. REN3 TaxID=2802440 RepID=UPI001FF07A92|nr:DUF3889 domain-containing protein [Bacillus sp. REN3]
MRNFMGAIFATIVLFLNVIGTAWAEEPGYEKYGRIATSVIKEDFPGEEVRDYEYLGRRQVSADEVVDSFHFKVMEGGRQKLVTVQISHHLKDKKTLQLVVTEEPGE